MKINFTKNQYQLLTELIYIGNYVLEGRSTEQFRNQVNDLEDYIFSFAKDFHVEESMQKLEDTYCFNKEKEDIVQELINDYDNENFWEEFTTRMGNKELFNKINPEKYYIYL